MQRVLVIDRDVDFINATRTVLEEMGFELEIALQGGTGVEIVTNRRIDLVLLGLDNLETPGPDLLQRVMEAKPGIPILAVVENVARYRMLEDLGDRVAGYVSKPLDHAQLKQEVENAFCLRPAAG